jgi:hypothetical protein
MVIAVMDLAMVVKLVVSDSTNRSERLEFALLRRYHLKYEPRRHVDFILPILAEVSAAQDPCLGCIAHYASAAQLPCLQKWRTLLVSKRSWHPI